MKLKIIFITSFLFVCEIAIPQTKTVVKKDSILFYLKKAKGKHKLKNLKKAVSLSIEIHHDSLIRETNIEFGLQSYFKKRTKELDFSQVNLYQLFLRTKDSFALAKAYHYKALSHLLKFKKDSSLYYYVESKNISILLKDSLEVGRRLLSMTNVQRDGKDFLGSEISAIEGLKYLEPIRDYRYTGSLYNSLGLASLRTNRNKEARMYFNKSLEVHKKNPNARRKYIAKFNFYSNSAITYKNEGNYDTAVLFYKKGLKLDSLEVKFPRLYARLLDNLSDVYLSKGTLTNVLDRLKIANKIKTSIDNIKGLSSNHQIQFSYYSKINDSKNALYHARKALEYARKSGYTRREILMLSALSKSKFISPKEANGYLKSYIKINDSISEQEKIVKNQFAKIRYETGKKEKENTLLKNKNDKNQLEIKQEKQQKAIGFLVAIGSLLLLGISVLVFKNRRKKLAFEAQLQKVEAREEERQQIAKSLHDEVAGDLRMLHQQLEKDNQTEIAESLNSVKNNVRGLSHQLSSVHFDEVSFKDQLINLVSDYFSSTCKISISGLKENDWSVLENSIKRTVYLCIRESVQNAHKYAKATHIKISLTLDKNKAYLSIEDNGGGFNVSENIAGIGLKNQRERIQELSGKIEIQSVISKGTTIKIEIPIHV